MATLDLSKLSMQELQDLRTDDAPATPRAQPVDTGLHPAHNQVQMIDQSEVRMPDRTGSLSSEEIAKTAQYQAQQEAYSLQQAGTPLTRDQFRQLVASSYDNVFKLNTPRTPEEEQKYQQEQLSNIKAKQDIGILPQKAKQLEAGQALELSAAQSSFDSLDQIVEAHKDNVLKKRPGFGTGLFKAGQWSGSGVGNPDWTPEGAAFVGLSEGSLPLFAKGISNVIGNPSESDMKSVRAMMINPSDSVETVAQKTKLYKEKIYNSQKSKLEALKVSGYDVSGLEEQLKGLNARLHPQGIPADGAAAVNLNQNTKAKLDSLTSQPVPSPTPPPQ